MSNTFSPKLISGKISAGRHHFSFLVYHGNDVYEIKPLYHKTFPSSAAFNFWWNNVVRRAYRAQDALSIRARAVVRRADIVPLEVKYITTVVVSASGGDVRFNRHVVGMRLNEFEFAFLRDENYLKLLHRFEDEGVDENRRREQMRQALLGLIPFTNRFLSAA